MTRKAENGLNSISANPNSPLNKHIFSFGRAYTLWQCLFWNDRVVFGYGYALTNASVGYISLLVESIGPGVMMCPSCPQASLYFIYAITTTLFSLLHIGWMMIACEGYSELPQKKGYLKIIWVILSHYGASFAVSEPNNKRWFDSFLCIDNIEFIHICQLWLYRLHFYLPIHHPRLFIHHHPFTQIKIQTFALTLPINLEWTRSIHHCDTMTLSLSIHVVLIFFFHQPRFKGGREGQIVMVFMRNLCIFSF